MNKQKNAEIKRAIRETMQNNVMRLVIDGAGDSSERYNQNYKIFLYLEIKNTKPEIRYLYDLSEPVGLGRNENGNQICIRDRMVSKYQGRIWMDQSNIYYADEPDAGNPIRIRRGLWTYRLKTGERLRLRTGDCLVVGTVKIKIRLFMGEQELFR